MNYIVIKSNINLKNPILTTIWATMDQRWYYELEYRVRAWCKENLSHSVYLRGSGSDKVLLFFGSENDKMHFKMKWL